MEAVAASPMHLSADSDVSPPREARITDITKVSVPMPFMVTLVGIALAFAAGVWRVESNVSVIQNAMSYERQLDAERAERATEREADYRRYIDQRFETLEAKIESSGLRNAAMALNTELQKQKGK
jgi:hypothetical protein